MTPTRFILVILYSFITPLSHFLLPLRDMIKTLKHIQNLMKFYSFDIFYKLPSCPNTTNRFILKRFNQTEIRKGTYWVLTNMVTRENTKI